MNTYYFIDGAVAALIVFVTISKIIKKNKTLKKIAEGAIVIDVRTPGEFAGGHYKGAINIPVDLLQKNIAKVGSKDKPVIVYCASGSRSSAAAGILKRSGFTNVFNVGGISNMPG
jgi:phage shock protein E